MGSQYQVLRRDRLSRRASDDNAQDDRDAQPDRCGEDEQGKGRDRVGVIHSQPYPNHLGFPRALPQHCVVGEAHPMVYHQH